MAVAAGGSHNLALQANGKVRAWGENTYGQTNVPSDLSNIVAIAAAGNHNLALQSDGKVRAWGYSNNGLSNVPSNLSNVVAIAAGESHNLALQFDGTVRAWGFNGFGVLNVPLNLSNAVAIAAGTYQSLALQADGTVQAWGNNDYGQTNLPSNLSNVVAIAAGSYHNLALIGNGFPIITVQPVNQSNFSGKSTQMSIKAVGAQPLSYQWLFNGAILDGATNTALNLSNLKPVDVGSYQVMVCNRLGCVTSVVASVTVPDSAPFLLSQPKPQVSFPGGSARFEVVADGSFPLTYQWRFNGMDLAGQTNSGLLLENLAFLQAGQYSVTVSNAYGGILSSNVWLAVNSVAAWGDNAVGQTTVPTNLVDVVALATGSFHSLALQADGKVRAWGTNNYGQTSVPSNLSNVVAIAAGDNHSLALLADGTARAWGYNGFGQTNVPANLSNVVAIAAGGTSQFGAAGRGHVTGVGRRQYRSFRPEQHSGDCCGPKS